MGERNSVLRDIRPVLLCGGMGRRLSPLSTPEKPKPFLPLLSSHSMLQETLLRVSGTKDPAILCSKDHAHLVQKDLDALSIRADLIIREPLSRNTAPAIALAAKAYQETEEILLFLPCDHKIENMSAFHDALCIAYEGAKTGHIMLFGERPDTPDTGYGYIQATGEGNILAVQKFHEKPDLDHAARYMNAGFFWNTGMIMARADALAKAFADDAPEIWSLALHIDPLNINQQIFAKMPDISIDYALLEKIQSLKLVPTSLGWSDIGTLDRLKALA